MKNLLLLLSLCLPISIPVCADTLKPFNASYTLEIDKEMVANTTISLSKTNKGGWEYRSFSEPTGLLASIMGITITETSHLKNQGDQIHVTNYRYDRTGKSKHVHLTFNWQNMSVTNNINGDKWTMKIPEGTTDKLSINLVLMARLGKQLGDASFPVADGGKLKYYDFKVAGEERLKTSLGNINTVKVYRNKRGRKGKRVTLWMAPKLNYLLVKMEKTNKKGAVATIKIQSLN